MSVDFSFEDLEIIPFEVTRFITTWHTGESVYVW